MKSQKLRFTWLKSMTGLALAWGFLAASPVLAGWDYDSSANTLTDNTSGWAFETSGGSADLTVKKVNTVGTLGTDLDFRSVETDTGCVITSFAWAALFNHPTITSVAFPDSVVTLSACVCQQLPLLTNVVLGANLKFIGENAFYGCPVLKTVTPFLPASVTNVGNWAFLFSPVEGKLSLVNTNGVTVGKWAFRGTTVGDVDFSGVVSMGNQVIEHQYSVTNVVLNPSLSNIPDLAFNNCSALKTVTPFLPASVTNVGEYAFYGCHISNDLHLENEDGVTLGVSGVYTYNDFTNAYLNVPGTLSVNTFHSCSNLREIWILDQPPTVYEDNCFYGIPAYQVNFHISKRQVPDHSVISGFAVPDATDMAREDYQAANPKPYGTITINGIRYWVKNWRSPFEAVVPFHIVAR